MKQTFAFAIVFAALLSQSAAFANVPSYYSSPPAKPSTGNSSMGGTGSNPNIVTGDHFSHVNPFTGQAGRHHYDINSNETILDNGYSPTIQLDCTHDDSCPPPPKQENHFKNPYSYP